MCSLIIIIEHIEQCRVTVNICTFTGSTNHHASAITVALGAVIGVLVILQIITLIGCGVVAIGGETLTAANVQISYCPPIF